MKRVLIIALAVMLVFTSFAFGETRAVSNVTKLTFSERGANCYVKLMYSGKAIDATLSLYKGSTKVRSWHKTGKDSLIISGTYPAEIGKTYTMKVKGKAGGKELSIPNIKKVCDKNTTVGTPERVIIKSVKSTTDKFTVTWKKAAGAVKYQVAYKKKSSSVWTKKTTTNTKLQITGSPLTTYSIKVRAKSKTKYGKWSKTKTVTTSLARPVAKAVQNGRMVEVSWNKVSKAKKYEIAYKKKSEENWNCFTLNLLYTNLDCEPRSTYQFKVRAIGPKSQKSLWSKIKTLKVESVGDNINELTPEVVGDLFDESYLDEGTNQYKNVYYSESNLPRTDIPEVSDGLKVYKIIHKDADLNKLKEYVSENIKALKEITGVETPEISYEKRLDQFDNYMYYGNHFEGESVGDDYYYSNIGAQAGLNCYDVFASCDRIKYRDEYLSILESDSDEEVLEKLGSAIDYYSELFGENFENSEIVRRYSDDGLESIEVYLFDTKAPELPSFMEIPSNFNGKPLFDKYIVLRFYPDWGEGTAYDWGGNNNEAFLTRVDHVESELPYDQYMEEFETARMLTLEEAQEMLANGYVFGGHSCPLCMAEQPEVDFSDYDAVTFEYVAGRNRIVVPFYTFYKETEEKDGLHTYAKTYVCAVDLPGIEEFFKSQEAYHKN